MIVAYNILNNHIYNSHLLAYVKLRLYMCYEVQDSDTIVSIIHMDMCMSMNTCALFFHKFYRVIDDVKHPFLGCKGLIQKPSQGIPEC